MDPARFDAVTKRLATGGTSRRRLLTGVGGALGATLLGVAGAAADNQCKPSGTLPQSKCNKNAQCCSGVCFDGECCTPLTTCPANYCGQSIDNGCGGTVDCLACPVTCSAGTCQAGAGPYRGAVYPLLVDQSQLHLHPERRQRYGLREPQPGLQHAPHLHQQCGVPGGVQLLQCGLRLWRSAVLPVLRDVRGGAPWSRCGGLLSGPPPAVSRWPDQRRLG